MKHKLDHIAKYKLPSCNAKVSPVAEGCPRKKNIYEGGEIVM